MNVVFRLFRHAGFKQHLLLLLLDGFWQIRCKKMFCCPTQVTGHRSEVTGHSRDSFPFNESYLQVLKSRVLITLHFSLKYLNSALWCVYWLPTTGWHLLLRLSLPAPSLLCGTVCLFVCLLVQCLAQHQSLTRQQFTFVSFCLRLLLRSSCCLFSQQEAKRHHSGHKMKINNVLLSVFAPDMFSLEHHFKTVT